MKIKISTLLFLALYLIALVSCVNSADDTPPIIIEDDYLNKQIKLRAPEYSNTFKTTDPIILELKYDSSYEIKFSNNYNLKIFRRVNEEWVELNEKPTERYPDGDILFSPTKEMPMVEVVALFPDLENIWEEYRLRVYVIGEMVFSEGIKKVAAFVDITLYQ